MKWQTVLQNSDLLWKDKLILQRGILYDLNIDDKSQIIRAHYRIENLVPLENKLIGTSGKWSVIIYINQEEN
jgi:hypothetical protein